MYIQEEIQALNALSRSLIQGLTPDDPKQAVDALRKVINYHDWRYYVLSEPIVSDYEYDVLFKELRAIEDAHPALLTADSPTQRVARALNEDFENVEHTIPMLSLDNSYNADDLMDFDRRVKELSGEAQVAYTVEPKFDGASIALIYENDILTRAATRGNGRFGDNITNNAKVIKSIPLKANFSQYGIRKIELRGEVIIEKNTFEAMNASRIENGQDPFQNARNTASGGLRMKDPNQVAQRGLEAFIYQIGYVQDDAGEELKIGQSYSQHANTDMLYQLGFKVPTEERGLFKSMDEVIAFTSFWEDKRDDYNYEIDGLVVKVDDYRLQTKIGATSHHPRWAMAYKFKAKQATTKLLDIDYQVGRTGAITPVAKVEPVFLAGVTISSISLHNEDQIKEKDIRIGDTVLIERAGDVIPYVVGPVKDARTGSEKPFQFIQTCPSCASDLVKPGSEAAWRCVNIECPAQAEERMIHFVSKGAMDIDGLGKDIVKRFMQEGLITSIPDLYQLDYEKILQLEGWKEKSVENLKKGLEASKGNPSWRLMVGLGVRHVGSTMAKALAQQVNHLLDFQDWTTEQLVDLEDVGPKVAESLQEFFTNPQNVDTIKALEGLGVNVHRGEAAGAASQQLAGKTFLFTGSLTQFTRDEAKAMVEDHGGKVLSGVSTKLNYLVAGEKAGSKLKKAEALGTIEVIDEVTFLSMLKDMIA
ncbi:MAG: NAD-dependent DNA ligase LigA [Saprospiraceae bacterium]|nr:NAD-dependent DNA ligase LigA [Saprospiraceae bacterium]